MVRLFSEYYFERNASMRRNNHTWMLLLLLIIFSSSCRGADNTKTATITETTTQGQTITKTETYPPSIITQTTLVTTTISTSEQQHETTTPLVSSSVPTTTTLPTTSTIPITTLTKVPSAYTTYTSSGLFSISYPSDWELLNYLLQDLDGVTDHVLSSIDSGFPLDQASYVFFAGLPTDTDWIPSINIVIESLSFSVSSLEQVVNAEILGIQQFVDTYIEKFREYTVIDGREATIIYWEGTNGADNFNSFQVYMFINGLVWVISLTPPPGEYNLWEADFYKMVESFHYLKK